MRKIGSEKVSKCLRQLLSVILPRKKTITDNKRVISEYQNMRHKNMKILSILHSLVDNNASQMNID
jgi:hypothetical protein